MPAEARRLATSMDQQHDRIQMQHQDVHMEGVTQYTPNISDWNEEECMEWAESVCRRFGVESHVVLSAFSFTNGSSLLQFSYESFYHIFGPQYGHLFYNDLQALKGCSKSHGRPSVIRSTDNEHWASGSHRVSSPESSCQDQSSPRFSYQDHSSPMSLCQDQVLVSSPYQDLPSQRSPYKEHSSPTSLQQEHPSSRSSYQRHPSSRSSYQENPSSSSSNHENPSPRSPYQEQPSPVSSYQEQSSPRSYQENPSPRASNQEYSSPDSSFQEQPSPRSLHGDQPSQKSSYHEHPSPRSCQEQPLPLSLCSEHPSYRSSTQEPSTKFSYLEQPLTRLPYQHQEQPLQEQPAREQSSSRSPPQEQSLVRSPFQEQPFYRPLSREHSLFGSPFQDQPILRSPHQGQPTTPISHQEQRRSRPSPQEQPSPRSYENLSPVQYHGYRDTPYRDPPPPHKHLPGRLEQSHFISNHWGSEFVHVRCESDQWRYRPRNTLCDAYPESPEEGRLEIDEEQAMDLRLEAKVAAEQIQMTAETTHESLKKISTKRKRDRGPKSWEFLMRLLADETTNPMVIRWENKATATFRLVQPQTIARMWGARSGKPELSYNNFARALRYHYSTKFLTKVSERQLVYGCGPEALRFLDSLKNQ